MWQEQCLSSHLVGMLEYTAQWVWEMSQLCRHTLKSAALSWDHTITTAKCRQRNSVGKGHDKVKEERVIDLDFIRKETVQQTLDKWSFVETMGTCPIWGFPTQER